MNGPRIVAVVTLVVASIAAAQGPILTLQWPVLACVGLALWCTSTISRV